MNFAAPPGSQVKIMDKKGMMHELDNRQSRYVAHKKKERKGWKKRRERVEEGGSGRRDEEAGRREE